MKKEDRESSVKQRQLIAIGCGKLGISKDDKEAMLLERFGKSSTTELNFAQAEALIDDFSDRGFTIKSKKRRYLSRRRSVPAARRPKSGDGILIALASPAELEKIDALSGLVTWKVENGQLRWMKKRFGISQVKTAADAFKVIEGLKGLVGSQMKTLHGAHWYQQDFEDIEICRFIAEHFSVRVYGALPAHERVMRLEKTVAEAV